VAGVDVVLLHGWMVGAELWAHQEDALAGVARPHEIVQPGHGVAVSRLRQNATMPDWAAWLSRELDGRGITDAVFVGHGMGGFLVEEMWRRDRRRIRALVLIATLDEVCSEDQRATLRALSDALTDWDAQSAATVLSALVGADFLAAHSYWVEDWREQVARTYDLPTVRELGRIAADHDDYRATSASIQVPTLVMHGSADSVIPLEKAKAMADRIPDARFTEIPDSGHAPPLEHPEPVTDALLEFVGGL
jgi:pimeloyl-ACP methyl ester carboxylesterase